MAPRRNGAAETLAEVSIPQSARKGREFFAARDAIETIKRALFRAGDGDITVTITIK